MSCQLELRASWDLPPAGVRARESRSPHARERVRSAPLTSADSSSPHPCLACSTNVERYDTIMAKVRHSKTSQSKIRDRRRLGPADPLVRRSGTRMGQHGPQEHFGLLSQGRLDCLDASQQHLYDRFLVLAHCSKAACPCVSLLLCSSSFNTRNLHSQHLTRSSPKICNPALAHCVLLTRFSGLGTENKAPVVRPASRAAVVIVPLGTCHYSLFQLVLSHLLRSTHITARYARNRTRESESSVRAPTRCSQAPQLSQLHHRSLGLRLDRCFRIHSPPCSVRGGT